MLTGEYKFLDASVINYINNVIKDNKRFIEERFQLWIENNEIENKNNPSAFVNKCFLKELRRGTFYEPEAPKIEHVPNSQALFNYMREKGVIVKNTSTIDIDISNTYLLKHGIVNVEEMQVLNQEITKYLADNKLSTDNYLDLLMKSNTLKGRFIDWNAIGNEINKCKEEYDRILNELFK